MMQNVGKWKRTLAGDVELEIRIETRFGGINHRGAGGGWCVFFFFPLRFFPFSLAPRRVQWRSSKAVSIMGPRPRRPAAGPLLSLCWWLQNSQVEKLMFSPTQGGGETHVFSGEARQRSSSPRRNIDVREGDRGGSCRLQSPPLFFLFPGFWLARPHWVAPGRQHPGGRARPL